MPSLELLSVLFPHFALLHVSAVSALGTTLRLSARCLTPSAACSGCGTESARVHSRYERSVADSAVGGRQLVLKLTVRRFFCDAGACTKKTFAEQVPDLTVRYGRATVQLRRLHEQIALALAGRAGARLSEVFAVGLGRDALIRRIRHLPDPPVGQVRVAGIDDFALKKAHVYGTVVVDIEGGRVVDVLPERTAEAVEQWLRDHPDVEVICRDRAAFYAEGATQGAPAAQQVADRWHLWHNLGQAAERAVARLRPTWVPPPPEPAPRTSPAPTVDEPRPDTAATTRIRERFAEVQALAKQGLGRYQIATKLRIDPKTAARYLRAGSIEELRAIRTRSGPAAWTRTPRSCRPAGTPGSPAAPNSGVSWPNSAASWSANAPCVATSSTCGPARPRPPRRCPRPARCSSSRSPTPMTPARTTSPS